MKMPGMLNIKEVRAQNGRYSANEYFPSRERDPFPLVPCFLELDNPLLTSGSVYLNRADGWYVRIIVGSSVMTRESLLGTSAVFAHK